MADTTVKYFNSTMAGAPQCSGEVGKLIAILDACLVNGFGSVTLDSLVITANVATGTVSAGHNFTMTGNTGPVVTIDGATPAELNGEWRIASVPGSTTFTFATTGISDQTATGTITVKRSPAGWTKVYSGTNKAAYRANAVSGNRLYLRVSDEGTGAATYCRVRGYETMSDVDTGTGPFPTDAQMSVGLYWPKSSTANTVTRPWRIFADHAGFVYVTQYDSTNWLGDWFGDIPSEKAGDAYATLIIGGGTIQVGQMGNLSICSSSADSSGHYLARTYAQTGTSITCRKIIHPLSSNYLGYSGSTFPAATGNQFYIAPVEIWESATVFRGSFPGLYNPLHASASLTDASIQTGIIELPNRDLFVQKLYYGNPGACAIDLTGPWR